MTKLLHFLKLYPFHNLTIGHTLGWITWRYMENGIPLKNLFDALRQVEKQAKKHSNKLAYILMELDAEILARD